MVLRLGTFNVWGLPEVFGFGDDVSSRMHLIARRLAQSDLDLLLIQEAWTEEVRETLAAGALDAGFEVACHPRGSGGLMTLSRLPIRSAAFERFAFRGDPERIAQGEFLGGKGFQTLRVDHAGRPLTVINTHLHARYRRARPRLNSAVRTAQLLEIVGRLHGTPGDAIVGGDFNCSAGDAEYEIFRALSRARELGGGAEHPTLSRTNFYKRHRSGQDKRIDFLFVRPGPATGFEVSDARLLFAEPARIRAIDRSLSDHFGFRATLALRSRLPVVAGLDPSRVDAEPLDPTATALAHDLLAVGRAEIDRRERVHAWSAGAWCAAAVGAAAVRRSPACDRRRFLRLGANAAALTALGPAIGLGTLARLDSDRKRDAFDVAHAVLARLQSRRGGPYEEGSVAPAFERA